MYKNILRHKIRLHCVNKIHKYLFVFLCGCNKQIEFSISHSFEQFSQHVSVFLLLAEPKSIVPISTFAHVCSLFGTFGREKKLVKPVNPRVKVRSTGFYPISPPWARVAAGTNHALNASTGHTLYSDKIKCSFRLFY